jgi:hypothetical protein
MSVYKEISTRTEREEKRRECALECEAHAVCNLVHPFSSLVNNSSFVSPLSKKDEGKDEKMKRKRIR